MADAPVMDSPNGSTEAGGSAFDDLMFADSNRDGRVGDQGFGNDQFQLRGLEDNRLIDAATPLLGLVIRVRRLADFQGVENLYQQVVDEVAAIDRELVEQGYERPTVVAYRYVLCAFIDEAVLGTDWGAHSVWSQHSLLSRFHNETWGGEKVFAITARMEQEPERYRDMLEFIYLCLCLGFEGRYRVMSHGRDEYEQVVRALGDQLAGLKEPADESLTTPLNNVVQGRQRRGSRFSTWGIFALFGIAMVGVYLAFSWSLDQQADQITSLLNQLYR